jgi:hypothetical protein
MGTAQRIGTAKAEKDIFSWGPWNFVHEFRDQG